MKTINTGGPAFPNTATDVDGTYWSACSGMHLRDYLAAKAMQGDMARGDGASIADNADTWLDAAEIYFEIADAMLKAGKL